MAGAWHGMGRLQLDLRMTPDAAGLPGSRGGVAWALLGGRCSRMAVPRSQGEEVGEDQKDAAIHILDTIP